jgi:putative PIN family toxin of toxin-antitoxin system
MKLWRIVIDTNVLVSAMRSRRGASFCLVSLIGTVDSFEVCLSVPLVLEYEEVLKRQAKQLGITHQDVEDVLDYLCSAARLHEVFYLWRPVLRDPKDDFVLEVAAGAGCEAIITFNRRDFEGALSFGVRVEGPKEFLRRIGELP